MDVINLSIIYLACGAPFAVHNSFRVVERFGFRDLAHSVGIGLVWPVFAILYLYRELTTTSGDTSDARLIEYYRSRLENDVDLAGRPDLAFEFRDTVSRYLGLSLAKSAITAAPAEEAIFALGSHPTPHIASACIVRRNRARIEHHASLSTEEFRHAIDKMNNDSLSRNAVSVSLELNNETMTEPTKELRSLIRIKNAA